MLTVLLLRQAFQRIQSGRKLLVSRITFHFKKDSLSTDPFTTWFSVLSLRSPVRKLEVWEVLKLHLTSAQNGPPLSELCTIRTGKCSGGYVVVIVDLEWESLAHWIGL